MEINLVDSHMRPLHILFSGNAGLAFLAAQWVRNNDLCTLSVPDAKLA
jgi:hypothetical protein